MLAIVNEEDVKDTLSLDVAGGDVMFLVFDIFFWWFLVWLVESGVWRLRRSQDQRTKQAEAQQEAARDSEDPARAALAKDRFALQEEERVAGLSDGAEKIQLLHFGMTYKEIGEDPVVAVRDISFGLDYGECFALLGASGAGKTTTFRAMTRDINATSGEVAINDEISKQSSR